MKSNLMPNLSLNMVGGAIRVHFAKASCPLLAHSGLFQPHRRVSAFRGKADIPDTPYQCQLMTHNGHSNQVICEQKLGALERTERKGRKARHRLRIRLPPRRSKQQALKPSELRLFVHSLE